MIGLYIREYLEKHNISGLFDKLTEDLIVNRPEEPYTFLGQKIKEYSEQGFENVKRPKVVFILGGPGSGKGTQCKLLVDRLKFVHYSAGDLLRGAIKEDKEYGNLIDDCIRNGKIVPGHITIALLRKAIFNHPQAYESTFLIDGFPREMIQCLDFEQQVTPGMCCLFFECPFSVLEERILERGKTSGRSDDTIDVLKKRFISYEKQTLPVIEYFNASGRVRRIDSSQTVEEVFVQVQKVLNE